MYDKANAVGPGSCAVGKEREPAAFEVLQFAENLSKRACNLNDRMGNKLSVIARDCGPQTVCEAGAIERAFPPFFEQLRQNFRMIEIYLNGMEDTLDRVEL